LLAEIEFLGGQALLVQGDIGRESDVVELFKRSERALGPIMGLVNNAGVTGGFARVENVEGRMLERLFAVNIGGSILCAREAIKRMSTKHGGCGGSIVKISSLAARRWRSLKAFYGSYRQPLLTRPELFWKSAAAGEAHLAVAILSAVHFAISSAVKLLCKYFS
jgi:NAD(P)-dependent dehydrogenase (short-subunit alcohol dehydrogenase family)